MIFYLLFSMMISVFFAQAEFLELPPSIGHKAIYHKKAYQLDEFCCGYNALYNGCNLERACGMPNRFTNYASFKGTCLGYLRQNRMNPKDSVDNKTLDTLARNVFGMQQLCCLMFTNENKIEPLFSTSAEISYVMGTPRAEINRQLRIAVEKRAQDLFKGIKMRFDTPRAQCQIAHFICIIKARGESHGILISLIQNRTGKALYIFDNMNLKIEERGQIKRCIDFLSELFGISQKTQFRGPRIPDIWPSTPKRSIMWDENY